MDREQRSDGFTEIGDRYNGYTVYDQDYDRIGKVDDLFVDETDQPEYIGVKMGFLGTRSTLIPFSMVRVNDERQVIEVASDKDTVKNGPTFDDDREITPEFENELYSYYGLQQTTSVEERGSYNYVAQESSSTGYTGTTGASSGTANVADDDQLRVQRSEEELVAGTREREAGALRVRKRVRVDRERIEVPTRHEEVHVERVPVNQAVPGAEIGEDEVVVPVTEEEVVVGKQAVVKEEIRISKDVVEETQVVEEEVRKEEIDIVDDTDTRRRNTTT